MTTPSATPGRQHLDRLLADPTGFAAFTRTVRAAERRHPGVLPLDELFQETARRALASAGGFTGTSREQLLAWVKVIADRVVIDTLRARRPTSELPNDLRSGIDEPSAGAERTDDLDRVLRALGRSSPQDRALLLARFRDGLEPRQIARVTGLSGDAVRQRLSRLLRELRVELPPW